MKFLLLVCLSLALVFGHPEVNDEARKSTESYHQIAPSLDKFTEKFYSHLTTAHPNENLFFSSVSISIAFSMLSLGAGTDTCVQILEGLGFDTSVHPEEEIYKGFQQLMKNLNQPNPDLELDVANALFVDKRFNLLQTYKDNTKKFYQSEVISIDFHQLVEAINQINSYVKKKTNGKIQELLSPNHKEDLVLINTIFFKGSWKYGFNAKDTREEDFHVDGNTIVKVPMMTAEDWYSVAILEDVGCTVVKILYTGNVSAIFIIPKEGKMVDVEKAFQEGSLRTWIKKLEPMEISLSIPKFSVSTKLDLVKELTPIGFAQVFSCSADFSGISIDRKLKVSEAVHKAVIEVNEEGTVASAASAIATAETTARRRYPEVKADRPFIMTIVKDDDNTALFTGRILNPTL
ncbi:plasma serine protease inhibitor-like isoform X2 [Hyla sarda]|nr:plasma serine protease inhibitor-like isoform X2 [Hyla sarda]XP_056403180.1 plasma serine protease inhibitor-like isoform X2 [Hyla sarda]XP_056403181.1 plasma serine protease inhibitor-like isoform X2 [Hyla sarda]